MVRTHKRKRNEGLPMSSPSKKEDGSVDNWSTKNSMLSYENESSENIPQTMENKHDNSGDTIDINTVQSTHPESRNKQPNNSNNETDEDKNDSDSESEIEFLLTILPPSPNIPTKTRPLAKLQSALSTPRDKRLKQPSRCMESSDSRPSSNFISPYHQQPCSFTNKDRVSPDSRQPNDHHHDPQNSLMKRTNQCSNQTMAGNVGTNPTISNDSRQTNSNRAHTANVSPLPTTENKLNLNIDSNDRRKIEDTEEEERKTTESFAGQSRFRRSAYLQSLAEICHAILWDARWRVGPQQKRLLEWEKGDDLSAIYTLAERYIPIDIPKPPHWKGASTEKTPMLVGGGSDQDESNQTTTVEKSLISLRELDYGVTANATTESHSNDSNIKDSNDLSDLNLSSDGEHAYTGDSEEEAYDRCLNLYCRLFYRKGPYFRVDDIFKYYRANLKKIQPKKAVTPEMPWKDGAEEIEKDNRKSFFRPQKKKASNSDVDPIENRVARNTICDDMLLDIDLLHGQLNEIRVFVEDWKMLHKMGLLRTFTDEEECGRTVGKNTKNGILKQDEQCQILQLLGCKKSSNDQKTNPGPISNSENLVWKQMTHQTSIQSTISPGIQRRRRRGCVLPVIKHMNATILYSWAKSVVLKASKKDCIPTANLQSLTMAVKGKLLEIVGSRTEADAFPCCSRLREQPLTTLRRCFRLYLCATSGPGNMHGDDNTAWKSLPESHSKDLTKLPLQHLIHPPGSNCWNKISCPGKDYRFKIISCNFLTAHEPLDLGCDENCGTKYDQKLVQVFPTLESFSAWEITVDLRANVDYLMTLRDVLRYNERKRSRQQNEVRSDGDNEFELNFESVSVDFHDLLTPNGRERTLRKLCVDLEPKNLAIDTLIENIENDVGKLEAGFAAETSRKLHVECDKILAVVAVIALHTLAACNIHSIEQRLLLYEKRPWLRHLRWEGCLAYILWDTVKTLECKLDGFYELAVKALCVLLFGKAAMPSELVTHTMQDATLMPLLLSRRTKGKAYERLTLDYLHHLRQMRKKKQQEATVHTKLGIKEKLTSTKRKSRDYAARKKEPTPNEVVASFNKALIEVCVERAQIPFSAIRTLARRLKSPLKKTLEGRNSPEAAELGHRYSNDSDVSLATTDTQYSDWTPTTDHAVANSITTDGDFVGRRCSYISFEENSVNRGSLNVEGLAMEFYRTGRLPVVDRSAHSGGWVGWHDEGGKVRQLWRILSSCSVLGMDSGSKENIPTLEMATIHLTPYQSAPFDLHCGAEMNTGMVARRGFYERRKHLIEAFLNEVASLKPSEVADLVYKSVQNRFVFSSGHSDPTLRLDIKQVRSLSLLAAGMGGTLLSAICRCFFYDYRHYSGGLPDLTLLRVLSEGNVVDLGEWVGEGFHPDNQKGESVLDDRDSEFLGCNKVGDSRMIRGQRKTQSSIDNQCSQEKLTMPPRLDLSWNGSPVTVECMFSEVKSANDRLDARQEDWLNILDIHGNARVCKFGGKEK
ncbi:unnamed protein product [Cylindrotheca closterium]|uniref:Fanconi-associated nuclease n=1 Tax=Cylindrotheca closterium TaxID=2856 RepID=A0AAD2CQB6_9STRA|nr:unnamed protein product [Cylindrotheca closterium]